MELAQAPVRFLYRDTKIYFSLMKRLTLPSNLVYGIDAQLELEVLARPFTHTDNHPFWQLFNHEINEVLGFDIPRYMAQPKSTDFFYKEAPIVTDFFEIPAWNQFSKRLNTLNQEDLQQQVPLHRDQFPEHGNN